MKVRAIKIDVVKMQVYEIYLDSDDLQTYYDAIGNGCSIFEAPIKMRPFYEEWEGGEDAFFVDGEIMLRIHDVKGGFALPGFTRPLVNNGLIVGADKNGETINHRQSLEVIQNNIQFFAYNGPRTNDEFKSKMN